jgi:hypothetical protein
MRQVADALQQLEALLGHSHQEELIRLTLNIQVDRLEGAARMLTIESRLGNPKSSGWIAKVGKSAAGVALIIASSAAAAIGTQAGDSAYNVLTQRQTAVVQSLDSVLFEADSATVQLLNYMNSEEARLRQSLNQIAAHNHTLIRHPATAEIANPKYVTNPPADLEDRVRGLMGDTNRIMFAIGPADAYDLSIPEHAEMVETAETVFDLQKEILAIEADRIELSGD